MRPENRTYDHILKNKLRIYLGFISSKVHHAGESNAVDGVGSVGYSTEQTIT